MVLFPNDTLTFYSRGTPVKDGEGNITSYDWTLYKAVRADVQPIGQEMADLGIYGLENFDADDRIACIDNDSLIKAPMKVVSTKTGIIYELVAEQPWQNHTNVILKPFQKGQTE